MSRARRRAVVATALVLLLGACTSDPEPPAAPVPPPPTGEEPAEEDHEDATAPLEAADPRGEPADEDEADPAPVAELTDAAVAGDDFPRWGDDPARLIDARLLAFDGHDRLVLEFAGSLPSWEVRTGERPVLEQPAGTEVELPGQALLEVRLVPATTLDRGAADPTAAYEGPAHLEGGAEVLEALLTGDHGDLLVWTLALDAEPSVAVVELEGPVRLVVDVAAVD